MNHHPDDHSHHSLMSRRQVLASLGAAGMMSVAAPRTLAELIITHPPALHNTTGQGTNTLFRIEKVTGSVYAAIAKPQAMLNCNATVIVTADHALVVDSHSKPSAAHALIAQIRKEITDKPVRYCVNTHFHWDHAQGNPSYPDAFGKNVDIVASTPTRDWLAREGAPRLKQSLDGMPKRIAELRAEAEKVKTQANNRHPQLMQQVAELEEYQKEMKSLPITLPTITFDQRMVLHHGGREIHLIFLGRGHTAGDVVVYLPAEKVIATGDLMHSILPYCGDSYPEEWPRTLRELEKIDFTRVVSGHGSVQEGKSILAFFRSYIEEINEGVSRGVQRGAGLAEIQATLEPHILRPFNTDPRQAERLVRETEALLGAVPDPKGLLKGAVASNVAEIYNYYTKRKSKGGI
jgi:cyclase